MQGIVIVLVAQNPGVGSLGRKLNNYYTFKMSMIYFYVVIQIVALSSYALYKIF